ncbi:MAG TPA: tRNA 2-selenouridine(34) synthase MnmH [Azoarcus sp.]|nr:tRNA 2-selenouridine(34) synthase MnmH [Azoarcus sp.]
MKRGTNLATVAELGDFDDILDARSPAEFAEDRIPGALSFPVLDNEQRATVGTIYKQRSAFEARRLGAAWVAENIARHLRESFPDKPRNWRPLVYCWRGGQRSGAFVTWLRMIGWDARQLEGGYKSWRRHVLAELDVLPKRFDFRVIGGPTGSAKTRILQALNTLGAQIIDLEEIAAHKGSVFGVLPDRAQPPQKLFETELHQALSRLDPERPVFIEAESRKIGRLHLPETLIRTIREAPCIAIQATREARLEFLVRDYAYLGDDIPQLQQRIDYLHGLQSNETLKRWKAFSEQRALPELFSEFIALHYDPLYRRSQHRHYARYADAQQIKTDDLSPAGIQAVAEAILASAS